MSNDIFRENIAFKEATNTSYSIVNVCIQTMINSEEDSLIFKDAGLSG